MINYAIIAAGEGSRLKQEGIDTPKPLVTLNGVPMIARLIKIFANQGAQQVHVIINSKAPQLESYLRETDFGIPIKLLIQDTPSSLHSFHALVEANPDWENCCLTTTDTIFKEPEFETYIKQFNTRTDCDAYMAITPFIDDESPLYVNTDNNLNITAFADDRSADTAYVSGGIYGLRKRALASVKTSVASGNSRMRNYQRALLSHDLRVQGHVFQKIVDVDHIQDRATAEAFIANEIA